MDQLTCIASHHHRQPWNKGKLVGQKAPLRLKEIWAIRIRLQLAACGAALTDCCRRLTE
jgi:hypothetical protein